jgi:hypothetical protein
MVAAGTTTIYNTSFNSRRLNTRLRFGEQGPSQEFVGLVLVERGVNNVKTLAVVGDLVPITFNILKITREVAERSLEDFAVDIRVQVRLHLSVFFVSINRISNHIISSTLDGTKVFFNLFRVVLDKLLITNVKNLEEIGEG